MPSKADPAAVPSGADPASRSLPAAQPAAGTSLDRRPLLEASGIVKRFPGCVALAGVNLTVQPGEVLALLGENGAGKSTLMKILAGVQLPDEGEIRVDGRVVRMDSVQTAQALGVALIHQELNLADNLDVAANIFLGREQLRWGLLDRRGMASAATRLLEQVSLKVSPKTLVSQLSVGQQQLVEIAKALAIDARLLIMDEPTSSLSQHETEALFQVIQDLRSRGVSVLYISHRLGEVEQLADRAIVFRNGRNAGELARHELTRDRMVRLMVGRDLGPLGHQTTGDAGPPVLNVAELRTPRFPEHAVSFELKRGEIVGLSGLVGAGRSEVLRCLFGVDRPVAGKLTIDGRAAVVSSPQAAIAAGLALVPEDRKEQGLVLEMAIRQNIGLAGLKRRARGRIFLDRKSENRIADEFRQSLGIKCSQTSQTAKSLSGGNQQKVVLAKWLSLAPRILLLDEPTRGIDVGAKQEIYQLMRRLADEGMTILFVSSEMEEILRMSDRVLVMHEGRLTGCLPRNQMTEEAIMQLATGGE